MSTFERPVADFMTAPVITIHPDASLQDAERRLEELGISCLGVADLDGHLVGLLSRTDVLRVGRLRAAMAEDPLLLKMPHQTVRTRMVRDVVTVDPTTPLHVAAATMVSRHIHRVFVVEGGRPVGVLSTRDLMRAVVAARITEPISREMSHPVLTAEVTDSVAQATDRLGEAHVRGLVVVEQGWPVGVFTQTEALAAASVDPATPVENVMSCALLCLPVTMPIFRAAAFAVETRARRILAVENRELRGLLSGLDMARIAAAPPTHVTT